MTAACARNRLRLTRHHTDTARAGLGRRGRVRVRVISGPVDRSGQSWTREAPAAVAAGALAAVVLAALGLTVGIRAMRNSI